ncbi:MAG: DNA-directed RNA polymerase subunit alpha [Candidatus Babeliales bacterium]|nr:DNA-directed RNA polymerase subunit alpha [Candidatus Babeliales bacterium]
MSNKLEYKPLTIPQIKWNHKTLTNTFGELVAQPLEAGFGITLGNALRRILLGAVEGSAVTSVIIKGVNNEFSNLPNVVEDVMQILLNIKEIIIRNKDGKPGKMHLRITSEGTAKTSDIQADDHLELMNPDHIIAHISEGGELDIEFFVESSRGYMAAQWPIGKALQEDNRIYLDAMFSPVVQVNFEVEKTRVGKDIDYDKLILNIHTDGSETPADVLNYCVSVLRTQLEHFLVSAEIPFNEISTVIEVKKEEVTDEGAELGFSGVPVDLLLKPIEELELSARAHNCLIGAGKKRILDLVNLSEDESLKIKNFGRKSLREVKESMKAFGLTFGMNIKEADIKKVMKNKNQEPE